jgi:hypothetical protein
VLKKALRLASSNPLTTGWVAAVAASVGLILFLLDQTTQRWAYQALPRAYPFNTCHPDSCIQLLRSWLVLKRSISLPLPLPGGPVTTYGVGALLSLAPAALIVTGGIRYPIHAMAAGLVIGEGSSAFYSYLRYGEIEKFIAIAFGGRPYSYFTIGFAAFLIGSLILLAGIATGSVRLSRRRRRSRPDRK